MYTPAAFEQPDLEILHDWMRQYSFATLISSEPSGPVASHLPLLLDETNGPHGCLIGHLAKANPQWKSAADTAVLAVFSGPHTYISPTWYAEDKVVPTWNYVAVHASGHFRIVQERSQVQEILEAYVTTYERNMPQPWSTGSQDPLFIDQLADAVVAFRIPIDQLVGKEKLNQNQSAARQQRVIAGLRQRAAGDDVAVADLMQQRTTENR